MHQVHVLVAPFVAGKSDRGHSGYLRFCGRAAFFAAGTDLRRAAGAFADRDAGARFATARLAGALAAAALLRTGLSTVVAFRPVDAPEDARGPEACDSEARLETGSSTTASFER